MADITCTRTTGRVTLSGTTVDLVTITDRGPVTVCNWTGTSDLTVTVATGPTGVPADPVVGAAETWAVPAGTARDFDWTFGTTALVLKVRGNGNVYSVDRG